MRKRLFGSLVFVTGYLMLFFCVGVAIGRHQQKLSLSVPDCRVVKTIDAPLVECREGYKPATYAQKQAFCREQWRQFLKPYRQSGRPPTNASMEGCEDVSQPRFTDEELERP